MLRVASARAAGSQAVGCDLRKLHRKFDQKLPWMPLPRVQHALVQHELQQSVPSYALIAAADGAAAAADGGDGGGEIAVVPVTRIVLVGGLETARGAFSARTVPVPARVGPGEADPNVWVLDLPPCDLIKMKQYNEQVDRGNLKDVTPETAPEEGRARCTYPDGAVYTGEFFQKMRFGKGRCEWPGGDSYDGAWASGMPQGEGTATFASPTGNVTYVGEWSRGMPHGAGRLTRNPGALDPKWTPELLGALVDEYGAGSLEQAEKMQDEVGELLDPLKRMYGGCLGSSCPATVADAREFAASGMLPPDILFKTTAEASSTRAPLALSSPWVAFEEQRSPVLDRALKPHDLCPAWVEAGPPVTTTTQAMIPDPRALLDGST